MKKIILTRIVSMCRVPFPVAEDGKFILVLHRSSGLAALDFGLESNSSFYPVLSPLLPELM